MDWTTSPRIHNDAVGYIVYRQNIKSLSVQADTNFAKANAEAKINRRFPASLAVGESKWSAKASEACRIAEDSTTYILHSNTIVYAQTQQYSNS